METIYIPVLGSTHIVCNDVDITYVIDWQGIGRSFNPNGICNMIIDNTINSMIGE